ncbi:MAG TPA: DUF4160 domain-containing protein [Thermoanaerobaculia bacterium]|nr:DUF4160 domain-containing protein [Thermoanaerobaculia bacterium]
MRARGLRFFFFSREEERMHVHVSGEGGQGKIWVEPRIEVARANALSQSSSGPALVRTTPVSTSLLWPPAFLTATLPDPAGVYSLMNASSFFANPRRVTRSW